MFFHYSRMGEKENVLNNRNTVRPDRTAFAGSLAISVEIAGIAQRSALKAVVH